MKYLLVLCCLFAACGDDGGGGDDVAPTVSRLVFRLQPGDTDEGAPLSVISIAATDADGNDVTSASGSVHLALGANPSGASLAGTVDAPFVDGVATLTGVTVSAQGTGFTLVASSDLVEVTATSMPFSIAAGVSATLSTLVVTPATVAADGIATATVTANIHSASGAPIANRSIALQVTGSGNHLVPPSGKTDAQGMWSSRIASTSAAAKTVTANVGSTQLTANIQFMPAPCTLRFPGVPTILQGISVIDVAIGDFDGDGLPDLSVLEPTNIAVHLGVGNGRYGTASRTMVPVQFPAVAAGLTTGDFDGDGKTDIVVATPTDLEAYLSTGTGMFGAPQTIAYTGSFRRMIAADVDGDTKLDVVMRTETEIQVYRGQGNGTFQLTGAYTLGVMFSQVNTTLEIADMNADGKLDVVTAGGTFSVLLGIGNATFMPAINGGSFDAKGRMAIGNFDGDTNLDVALSDGSYGYIAHGNGDGTLGPAFNFTNLASASSVFAYDVDGDTKLDLIAVGVRVQAFLGNGTGTFTAAPSYQLTGYVLGSGGAVADVDGDGRKDLVLAQYTNVQTLFEIATVLGGPGTSFLAPGFAGGYPNAITFFNVTGDFDGDGILDFLGSPINSNETGVVKVSATGALSMGTTVASRGASDQPVLGDFDGDSKLDVVNTGPGVRWLRGTGMATLSAAVTSATTLYPQGAVAARFDAGTTLDVALFNSQDAKVTFMFGTGTGTFGGEVSYTVGASPRGGVAADLDNDGDQDLVVQGVGSPLTILRNGGNGTFTTTQLTLSNASFGPDVMATGDLDADGNMDLAICTDGPQLLFLRGKGDGSFFPSVLLATQAYCGSIAIADLDLDGKLDILTTGVGASVMLGKGDGTFHPATTYISSGGRVVLGDLNGDGRLDLMTPLEPGLIRRFNAGCM